MLTDAFNEQ